MAPPFFFNPCSIPFTERFATRQAGGRPCLEISSVTATKSDFETIFSTLNDFKFRKIDAEIEFGQTNGGFNKC